MEKVETVKIIFWWSNFIRWFINFMEISKIESLSFAICEVELLYISEISKNIFWSVKLLSELKWKKNYKWYSNLKNQTV